VLLENKNASKIVQVNLNIFEAFSFIRDHAGLTLSFPQSSALKTKTA
jgi:hypothetical protein